MATSFIYHINVIRINIIKKAYPLGSSHVTSAKLSWNIESGWRTEFICGVRGRKETLSGIPFNKVRFMHTITL